MLRTTMGRVYGLSYRFAAGSEPAAVVVTIVPQAAEQFVEFLALHVRKTQQWYMPKWRVYIGEEAPNVELCDEGTLFSWAFGFDGVATREMGEFGLRYVIELRGEKALKRVAATCQFVLQMLESFYHALDAEEGFVGNTQQLMLVSPGHLLGKYEHSHPLVGQAHTAFVVWVGQYAARIQAKDRKALQGVAGVRAAMIDAWKQLHIRTPDMRRYAGYGRVQLQEDGRFALQCFGNACDVSIYPDTLNEPESGIPSSIDCHNLDDPAAQITLLAGLAALYELAANDLSNM